MPEPVVPATAAEVATAWAEIADLYDPVDADPVATQVLRDASEHEGPIAAALEHFKLVDAAEGQLLSSLGYDFCFERRLWRRGIEAVLQARVLQQVLVWAKLAPKDRAALENIVVRHTFHADLSFATPLLRRHGRFNFIVVPFVYQELLLLSAATLAQTACPRGAADAWELLDGSSTDATSNTPPPPPFRKLVARVLTSPAFDASSSAENPVSALSMSSGWFSGVDTAADPTDMESVLAYSAQDFALAHEIGHCLSAGDAETYLRTEQAADLSGLRLYAASWGWRDELLEGCPLGQGARVLLGPIWFFFSAGLLYSIKHAIARRVVRELGCDASALSDADEASHLAALAHRWHGVNVWLSAYGSEVMRLSGPISALDELRLHVLTRRLESLSLSANRWVLELPLESLRHAFNLGTGGDVSD